MSNHLHVVLHVNTSKAQQLSHVDIANRWHTIYKGTLLTQKFSAGSKLTKVELAAVALKLEQWRKQITSISWFMRALNEPIARMANAEDQCTGSFWESRFSSQALLDEKALAACLAYVDLNPVRAKMADTPENSDYTSIKIRVKKLQHQKVQPNTLYPFVGNPREPIPEEIPFKLDDYLNLVDWTGRILRRNKRGAIAEKLPPILHRIGIDANEWILLTTQFEKKTSTLVGSENSIRIAADLIGYKKPPGIAKAKALFT